MSEVTAVQKFTTGDPILHHDGRQALVLSVLADRMIVRLLGADYGVRVLARDYADWERDPDPPAHEPWIDPPGRPSVCTPVILNGRVVGMQLAAGAAPAESLTALEWEAGIVPFDELKQRPKAPWLIEG
jgi:hypothetical protein